MIFFCNRFYFLISIGSLMEMVVLVYVQDNIGRVWGNCILSEKKLIIATVLYGGTPFYRAKRPQESHITARWRVWILAWKKRSLTTYSQHNFLNCYLETKVPHTARFKPLVKATIIDENCSKDENNNKAWMVTTVTHVEEVKMIIKLIPIWSISILFWTVSPTLEYTGKVCTSPLQ